MRVHADIDVHMVMPRADTVETAASATVKVRGGGRDSHVLEGTWRSLACRIEGCIEAPTAHPIGCRVRLHGLRHSWAVQWG